MGQTTTPLGQAYGGERVRRGLMNFLLGKVASSLLGFAAMVLVVRGLSISEFAHYSIMIAFVEIGVALSGFGIAQVALRYVPELYANHKSEVLDHLIRRLSGLRVVTLALFLVLAYLMSPVVVGFVGLEGALKAFQVFLLIVFFRGSAYLLSQILESTLHQGWAQAAFSVSSAIKLFGSGYLLWTQGLSLLSVVWLEAFADLVAMLIALYGLVRGGLMAVPGTANGRQEARAWFAARGRGVIRYAVAGYLQHLAILPYGGHTNRMVGGATLSTLSMASYGFAQSLYEYVKRYLPAQLLMGMVRPVVIARYEQTGDFPAAVRLCSQIMQINILLCGLIAVGACVGGEEAFWLLTNGKYTMEALTIFMALMFVLVLETHRQQIDLLVQITRRYEDLIVSNAAVSASVLLALTLVTLLGAVAFPLANALGLMAANSLAVKKMRSRGFDSAYDWGTTAGILLACGASIASGLLLEWSGTHWLAATLLACATYALLMCFFMFDFVRSFWKNTTSGAGQPLVASMGEQGAHPPVRVAFGVLSSKHSQASIEQIADAVHPHPVYVHHDFSKVADWHVSRPNVTVLTNVVRTAWGDWSLVEASLRLMEEAEKDPANTHFQLLSEGCMVVRPIADFVSYLEQERPDFMLEMMPLSQTEALRSHGWRYLASHGWVRRGLRKTAVRCYPWTGHRAVSGINLNHFDAVDAKGKFVRSLVDWVLRTRLVRMESKLGGAHGCKFAVGSQWLGMSMDSVRHVLRVRREASGFMRHFQSAHIPDEAFFHSIAMSLKAALPGLKVAGSNHALFWFKNGTGPDEIDETMVSAVVGSGKFFARKFPLDPAAPVRGYFDFSALEKNETR